MMKYGQALCYSVFLISFSLFCFNIRLMLHDTFNRPRWERYLHRRTGYPVSSFGRCDLSPLAFVVAAASAGCYVDSAYHQNSYYRTPVDRTRPIVGPRRYYDLTMYRASDEVADVDDPRLWSARCYPLSHRRYHRQYSRIRLPPRDYYA